MFSSPAFLLFVFIFFVCVCVCQESDVSKGPLIPMINYSMVAQGVYRSGFPNKKNLPFLKKLGVKSVILLCPEDYPEPITEFFNEENCTVYQIGLEGNKEPFLDLSEAGVHQALSYILDTRNHPILIHCNKGKHRTGCVVGCLRRVQRWSLTAIFDEYRRFAGTKGRALDLQFIELFVPRPLTVTQQEFAPKWLEQ
eukprot:c12833_g2_i6.p1 GENE.c12833_g2_i6~~c12833_g2_i6.p1  ORF type:complete len:196 (+),score=32.05 c12833_g2_i6:209-796(+)